MRKKKMKKILISVISLVLAAAMGVGIWYGVSHSKKDPVYVISFQQIGMTEYWGDNMESHGPVSSDNIQTVFLSDTQKVTEVLVKEGDVVKKGDPLMTFDTTLSGLDLERKRLEVEKLKLQLLDEEASLRRIQGMRPMQVPPPADESQEENLGTELSLPYRISGKPEFDGSAADKPLICWLRSDTVLDRALIEEILKYSLNLQVENSLSAASSASAADGAGDTPAFPSRTGGKLGVVVAEELDVRQDHDMSLTPDAILGQGTAVYVFERWESEDNVPWAYVEVVGGEGWVLRDGLDIEGEDMPVPPPETAPPETEPPATEPPATEPDTTEPPETEPPATEPKPTEPKPTEPKPTEPKPQPGDLGSCYVILKVTEKDMSLGQKTTWQGFKLFRTGAFSFFDAGKIPDYTMAADLGGEDAAKPEYDMGSGYTAAQIVEMRIEQEKKIEETKLNVKMAEAEYKIKKQELEDGNVYSDFDGKVVSLLTEEESRQMRKPMIKVSGGGGFQVEGSVNELDREKMQIGQEVTVNDWNSGGTYTGKVISIGEFPLRFRGYSGRGNPNSSYYPFTVFVDGEADLQTGSYVSIQYASGGSENGIYLENPFLREEKGQSYVYVKGEDGRLEKRNVTTGKALWGSYTEITSGLTAEDYLAFPYGKNVKPGARTQDGDISDIYG